MPSSFLESISATRPTILGMAPKERDILERAVRAVSEQAAAASAVVDEAIKTGLDRSHPLTVHPEVRSTPLVPPRPYKSPGRVPFGSIAH
jgi:hypothetical protein